MSDIRRLNLSNSDPTTVSAVPREQYFIGQEKISDLDKMLKTLIKLPYWGPVYQAWEPFIIAYLRSGVAPALASTWSQPVAEKIEELGPRKSEYHDIFSEVLRMYRSSSVECFEGYQWSEIQQFVERIPVYIDNRRTINKFLFSSERYLSVLRKLVDNNDSVPYSTYLYRHCMVDDLEYTLISGNTQNQEIIAIMRDMQVKLDSYVNIFSDAFTQVCSFIGTTEGVYQWYTPKVKKLIVNAWKSSTDLTSNRTLITNKDVFSMPVWLSEQLTDYISSLPCTYTVQPDGVFILDSLEYALSPEANYSDVNMLYAFCIPKSYLKSFLDRLSQFYWDVKENRFVEQLLLMQRLQYQNSAEDVMHPDAYKESLKHRGFPVEDL